MTARGAGARRRGIRFEQEVARWFGTSTTRNTRPGLHDDGGDIVLPGFVVECKAHMVPRLPEWWREVTSKCQGDDEPVLITKAPGLATPLATVYVRAVDGSMVKAGTLAEWWPK